MIGLARLSVPGSSVASGSGRVPRFSPVRRAECIRKEKHEGQAQKKPAHSPRRFRSEVSVRTVDGLIRQPSLPRRLYHPTLRSRDRPFSKTERTADLLAVSFSTYRITMAGDSHRPARATS